MKKILSAIALALLAAYGLGTEASAQSQGQSPFQQFGSTISPKTDTACFTFPSTVTGGCLGAGTSNFGSVAINGSPIQGSGLAFGKVWIGNIGGLATQQTVTGDVSLSPSGVTAVGSLGNVTNGSLANSGLVHSSTTVNGVVCILGSTCTISASAAGITVGTTTVSGGGGGFLLDNSGVLGAQGSTGTGNVVRAAGATASSLTVTGSFTATGLVSNSDLANPSTTINGQSCVLGSSCVIPIVVGTTAISGGNANGLLWNTGGVVGNLVSANSGVLVTSGGGTPSISTTLPNSLAMGTPASLTLTNASGLPTTGLTGTLQAAQFPTLTGDVTTTAGSLATTLASVAIPGTIGSSTAIPVITINAKGLTTVITTAAVVAPAGTLSGTTLNSTVVSSSLTSVGTLNGLTVVSSFTATGLVTNADLVNASTTVNGQTCTLGSTCSISASATSITIGGTSIISGTPNGLLTDNGGTVGNLATANNGVLVTNASGMPSISSTLPSGLIFSSAASTGVGINGATGNSASLDFKINNTTQWTWSDRGDLSGQLQLYDRVGSTTPISFSSGGNTAFGGTITYAGVTASNSVIGTGPLVLGVNPGITITPTSASVATALQGFFSRTLSVLDYGAVCNGSTDDTVPIQATITAAGAITNGAQVVFPDASCKVTGTLNIANSGVALVGVSRGSSRLIFANGTQDGLAICATLTGGTTCSTSPTTQIVNIKLENLYLVGSSKTGGNILNITDAGTVLIDNVTVDQAYNGVYLQQTNTVSLRDMIINTNVSGGAYAIRWASPNNNTNRSDVLELVNVSIQCNSTGADGIDIGGMVQTLSIHSVRALNCNYGFRAVNTYFGTPSATYYPGFVLAHDFEMDGIAGVSAVSIEAGSEYRFVNSDISNQSTGSGDTDAFVVLADGSYSITRGIYVSNSRVGNAKQRAFYSQAKNVVLSNNIFSDASKAGSNLWPVVEFDNGSQDVVINGGTMGVEYGNSIRSSYGLQVDAGVVRLVASAVNYYTNVTGAVLNNSGSSSVVINGGIDVNSIPYFGPGYFSTINVSSQTGPQFYANVGGTNAVYAAYQNGSGVSVVGTENSAGNTIFGGHAYAAFFGSGNGGTELVVNNAVGAYFTSSSAAIYTMASGTGTAAVCSTTGVLTTDTSGTICGLSPLWAKNLKTSIKSDDALAALAANLRTTSWEYKPGIGPKGDVAEHVGLIADDVAAMDERCAVRDVDGKLTNYSDRCIELYLVGAVKALKAANDNLAAQVEILKRAVAK